MSGGEEGVGRGEGGHRIHNCSTTTGRLDQLKLQTYDNGCKEAGAETRAQTSQKDGNANSNTTVMVTAALATVIGNGTGHRNGKGNGSGKQ